jgi:hypothetical protein
VFALRLRLPPWRDNTVNSLQLRCDCAAIALRVHSDHEGTVRYCAVILKRSQSNSAAFIKRLCANVCYIGDSATIL